MKLKIATFNISGGVYEDDQSVDYLDKSQFERIDTRLHNDIVRIANEEQLDILCFQEIITTESFHYIDKILAETELKYTATLELSPCNTLKDARCGIAILSKYPLTEGAKELFTNPMLAKTTSSGNTYYTFDKGYQTVTVELGEKKITLLNHHNFPFRRFNSTPEANPAVFAEFDSKIAALTPDIVAGDFNAEAFLGLMPYLSDHYVKTIDEGTTDDGKKFDNILVKKGTATSAKLVKSFSDHYMVVAEIEL